jgi:hypothetical protein
MRSIVSDVVTQLPTSLPRVPPRGPLAPVFARMEANQSNEPVQSQSPGTTFPTLKQSFVRT